MILIFPIMSSHMKMKNVNHSRNHSAKSKIPDSQKCVRMLCETRVWMYVLLVGLDAYLSRILWHFFPLDSVQLDPHVRKCVGEKFGHPNIYGLSRVSLYRDVCPTKAPQWRAYGFCLVDISCSLLALLILGFGPAQINNRFCFAWRCAICTGQDSLYSSQCRL